MGFFGKKKDTSSPSVHVTENRNMTRWERRACSKCGNATQHKISRNYEGSSEATTRCTNCGHWENDHW